MVKFLNRWWLPALIVSVPFERIPSFDVGLHGHSVTLRLSLLIALIGIIGFGIDTLRHTDWRPSQPPFWLAVYLAVALTSLATSIDKGRSAVAFIATGIIIATGLIVARVLPRFSLHSIKKYILVTAGIVSLFGLYQFIGDSIGLSSHLTGLRPIYTKLVFGFPRVQSTGLEPLFFANYLIVPILLLSGLAFAQRLRAKIFAPLLMLYSLTLALTLSRGGIIGGTVGLTLLTGALWAVSNWRSRALTLTSIIIGGMVAVGLIFGVTALTNKQPHSGSSAVNSYIHQSTQVTSGNGTADSDRVIDRRLAVSAFRQRPLLGQGIGAFGTYAKRTDPINYPASANSPTVNNEYLEILAETGLLGFLALAGFIITLAMRVVNTLRQPLSKATSIWVWSFGAIIIAFGIQYYAFSTLYIMNIWVTFGLLLGLTAASQQSPAQKPRSSK